jgi:MerR family transcriptional regulator, light-induced transcriptional regulator
MNRSDNRYVTVTDGHVRAGEPTLTVASVARRLGVSPTTLRTWDRRHGLGPSQHQAGTHRRYSAEDVARLEMMRRLTTEGVSAGEAARIALATEPDQLPTVSLDGTADGNGSVHPTAVPLGRIEDRVRGLVRAADGLDSGAVNAIVRESLDRRGVIATWDGLIVPALVSIGSRWARTGQGVDVEHLASECVLGVLRQHVQRFTASPVNTKPILLACAEEEQHSLPLHAVSAALAERHVVTRVLGARVPSDALAAAIRRIGPAAVFLWAQRPHTGDPQQLAVLPEIRPAPLVAVAGPGWPEHAERWAPRHRVVQVHDLSEAVSLLARAVGA